MLWLPVNVFEPVVANDPVFILPPLPLRAKFSRYTRFASPSANVSGDPFVSLFTSAIMLLVIHRYNTVNYLHLY